MLVKYPRMIRTDLYFRELVNQCWLAIVGVDKWDRFLRKYSSKELVDQLNFDWIDNRLYCIWGYHFWKYLKGAV